MIFPPSRDGFQLSQSIFRLGIVNGMKRAILGTGPFSVIILERAKYFGSRHSDFLGAFPVELTANIRISHPD